MPGSLSIKDFSMLKEPESTASFQHVPSVDPIKFGGNHNIKVWDPGRLVTFGRPFGLMIIFTLILFLMGLSLGLVLIMALGGGGINVLTFFVFFGVTFLLLWMGAYGTLYYLPHTMTINWNDKTVTWAIPFRKLVIPFHEIEAVILQEKRGRGGGFAAAPLPHGIQYCVQLKFENFCREDPSSFYGPLESDPDWELPRVVERWIPVLQDLSRALGVPGKVLTEDGKVYREI